MFREGKGHSLPYVTPAHVWLPHIVSRSRTQPQPLGQRYTKPLWHSSPEVLRAEHFTGEAKSHSNDTLEVAARCSVVLSMTMGPLCCVFGLEGFPTTRKFKFPWPLLLSMAVAVAGRRCYKKAFHSFLSLGIQGNL